MIRVAIENQTQGLTMADGFHITIDTKKVDQMLTQTMRQMSNTRPLMAAIANELHYLSDEAFTTQGQVGGQSWTPLAASTIAQRTKQGTWPGHILNASGRAGLVSSLQAYHSDSQASLSSSKPYAAIHQFGGQAGRNRKVTIPARPYMPMTEDKQLTNVATQSVLAICQNYFQFK